MARKLFISILGAGIYGTCRYTQEGFRSTETRFIQQATLELISAKESWTEQDRICILLTDGARRNNWDKTITERMDFRTNENIPYKGLESVLQHMNLPAAITPIAIPDGRNEEEMWEIFQTAFSMMEEGDEVYFDLTHSFRYLPMLILVLGNYAKFLKNVHIAHISYGNYEARDKDRNEAPIVDLLPLTILQDWTFAAADYLRNGQTEQLVMLSQQVTAPILRATHGQNEQAQVVQGFTKALQSITENMQICRGLPIISGTEFKKLNASIDKMSDSIIAPLVPLVGKIGNSFVNFTPNDNILNGLHAAQWCFDNRMYQQSITILQETIVTLVCNKNHLSVTDKHARALVNAAFHIVSENKQGNENDWKLPLYGKNDEALQIVRKLIAQPFVTRLASSFMVATNLRNDFNHAGFRDNPSKPQSIITKIGERIQKVRALIYSYSNVHQPL